MTPADILPKAFNYEAGIIDKGGYLVTNHYLSTPDDEELYSSKDCRDAIGAILHLVERELQPECIDEDTGEQVDFSKCFDYDTSYDEDRGSRRMDVVSKGNIKVRIGDHWFKTMDQGERFCLVSAAKLGKKEFDHHAKNAGSFEPVNKDHRIALREPDSDEIFGYSSAIKVAHKPKL